MTVTVTELLKPQYCNSVIARIILDYLRAHTVGLCKLTQSLPLVIAYFKGETTALFYLVPIKRHYSAIKNQSVITRLFDNFKLSRLD